MKLLFCLLSLLLSTVLVVLADSDSEEYNSKRMHEEVKSLPIEPDADEFNCLSEEYVNTCNICCSGYQRNGLLSIDQVYVSGNIKKLTRCHCTVDKLIKQHQH